MTQILGFWHSMVWILFKEYFFFFLLLFPCDVFFLVFIYLLLFRHVLGTCLTLATEVTLENWKRKKGEKKNPNTSQCFFSFFFPQFCDVCSSGNCPYLYLAKFVDILNTKVKDLELLSHVVGWWFLVIFWDFFVL